MSLPHSTNHPQAAGSYPQPILVESPIPSPTSYPGFSFLAAPGGFPSAKSGLENPTDDTRGAQSSTNRQLPSDYSTADQLLEGGIPRAAISPAETLARASAGHERNQSEKQGQKPAPVSLAAMQLRLGKKPCDPMMDGSDERRQPILSGLGFEQRVPKLRENRPAQSNNGAITTFPRKKEHSGSDTVLESIPQYQAEVEDEDSPFAANPEALTAIKAAMRPTNYQQFMKKYQARLAEEQTKVADLDGGVMRLLDLEMRILEETERDWETEEQSRRAAASNTILAESLITVRLSSDQAVRQQSVCNESSKKLSCPCGSETCWVLDHFKDVPQRGFQSVKNGSTGAVFSLNAEKHAEYSFLQALKKAQKD